MRKIVKALLWLNAVDALVTIAWASTAGSDMEVSPLMAALLASPLLFLVAKIAGVTGICVGMERRVRNPIWDGGLVLLVGLYAFACLDGLYCLGTMLSI